jgi:small subunit ribosomal protein S4
VLPKVPGYLNVDLAQLKATLVSVPDAASVPIQVNIQYVVEYYAR